MATITRKGAPIETVGFLPALNSAAPPFSLTGNDLEECELKDFSGKIVVLNIFPSIDTPTCAQSVRTFNQQAAQFDNSVVLCISADLPFAHKRFCEVEGLKNVISLSTFRSEQFGLEYGVTIKTGPRRGLLSRAIVVIDGNGKVRHTEQVAEIIDEPDYQAVLKTIAAIS
jgi:thiol peroxidase